MKWWNGNICTCSLGNRRGSEGTDLLEASPAEVASTTLGSLVEMSRVSLEALNLLTILSEYFLAIFLLFFLEVSRVSIEALNFIPHLLEDMAFRR